MLDKSPLSGPGRGPPSCNNRQLWWDPFAMTDSLTTWGTQGPAHLPTNQTQQLLPEPFCPWSPPDADDWPECPNQVTNKKVCWPFFLFPLSFLFSIPPILPSFLLSWYWTQKSDWRASAWAEGWSLVTSGGQRTPMILSGFWKGQVPILPSYKPRKNSYSAWASVGVRRHLHKATPFCPASFPSSFNLPSFPPFEIFDNLRYLHLLFVSTEVLGLCRRFPERLQSCDEGSVWLQNCAYVCFLFCVLCCDLWWPFCFVTWESLVLSTAEPS